VLWEGRQNPNETFCRVLHRTDQIIITSQQHQFTMSRSTNVNGLDRPLERDISISTTRVRLGGCPVLAHSFRIALLPRSLSLAFSIIIAHTQFIGDQLSLFPCLWFFYIRNGQYHQNRVDSISGGRRLEQAGYSVGCASWNSYPF
jgi:hypothetical protein